MSFRPPSPAAIDSKLAIAAVGVIAVIVYGSLFPFHFRDYRIAQGAVHELLSSWRTPANLADNVSNILLYVPLGLFLARAFRSESRWMVIPVVTLAGFALSLAMELAQYYDPGRSTEMADVYANTVGTLAGAIAAASLRRNSQPGIRLQFLGQEIVWRPFALLLLACWAGNRLFPYVPTLDFRAHVTWALPAPLELFKQTVCWLTAGALLESLFDTTLGTSRSRIALAGTVAVVLIARLFLISGTISPAEVYAALIALVAWAVLSRFPRHVSIVALLFVAMVILQALNPFHFDVATKSFGWIPFLSFIDGPRDNGVRVFFEKGFTYGALLWLPVSAGVPFRIAVIFGAALVFGLRLAQVFLPERSAEITDAVMVLMLAGVMWLVDDYKTPATTPLD